MTNPISAQSTAVNYPRQQVPTTLAFPDVPSGIGATPSTISRDQTYQSGWFAAPRDAFEFFFGQNNIFSALLFGRRYDDSGLSAFFHIVLWPISILSALVNLALLPIRIPFMVIGLIQRQLERI